MISTTWFGLWIRPTSDSIVVNSAFAITAITDTATAAFVWSYSQLLNNWDPAQGWCGTQPIARREFDAIQATGSLAAATAQASQLGIIARADAIQIVSRISNALLVDAPRYRGLLPHFVKTSPTRWSPLPHRMWSGRLSTRSSPSSACSRRKAVWAWTLPREQLLRAVDWNGLLGPERMISMGYKTSGRRVGYEDEDTGAWVEWFWDTFGGESWLVGLAYASASGEVAAVREPAPPTANDGIHRRAGVALRAAAIQTKLLGNRLDRLPIGGHG